MFRLSDQSHLFRAPVLRQVTLEVEKINGINLAQGVCMLPPPPELLEFAHQAALSGINRYTNPRGLLSLREALAAKLAHFNGFHADPETQILATCGATGAFEAVCAVLLNPGDEVIILEPSYPYHVQALMRYQAVIKTVALHAPEWKIDFDAIQAALTPKTKFILVNTPGNPTGRVWTKAEFLQLAALLEQTDALLVTDEIYEYLAFDAATHVSAAALPELKDRTLTIGGYSKTFAITGWRVGYLVVPEALGPTFTSFLDAVYVCPPAPLQQAVADTIQTLKDDFYVKLNRKYQGKRDRFAKALAELGFDVTPPAGAYYLIAGFQRLAPGLSSAEFNQRLIEKTGVGAVPSDDFVRQPEKAPWVRFCLAHEDVTLDRALDRLYRLSG